MDTVLEPGGCSCGCGSVGLITKAREPCRCECECCSASVASKDEEIAGLETLGQTVERRLRIVASDGVPARRHRSRPLLDTHHRLIAAGLVVVLSPFLLLAWVASTSPLGSDRVGLRAPVFALPTLAEGTPYGTEQVRGRPTIVVFWARGCLPCADELRLIQQTWERSRHQGLAVVGVQEGPFGDAEGLDVLAANGITFPNVRDGSGVVGGSFGLMGVPEAYFVDSAWRVQAVDRGDMVGVNERLGLVVWSAIPPGVLERRVSELAPMGTSPPGS